MTLSKVLRVLAGAAIVTSAAFVGAGEVSAAGPGVVRCVNGDGVATVALANSASDAEISYTVIDPRTFVVSTVAVAPGASSVVVFDGLADGALMIPITHDGVDASVSAEVRCDPPVCDEGALTTVVDDAGAPRQACVAVAAAAAGAPVGQVEALAEPVAAGLVVAGADVHPARSTALPASLPSTGTDVYGLYVGAGLVLSGSLASYLGRRRAS